jgi:hypothetical protein
VDLQELLAQADRVGQVAHQELRGHLALAVLQGRVDLQELLA